jgi:hypothetical protein
VGFAAAAAVTGLTGPTKYAEAKARYERRRAAALAGEKERDPQTPPE